jgi:hypothetical protein
MKRICCCFLALIPLSAGQTISTVFELYNAIKSAPGTDPVYLGVLSQGNFDSVAKLLPSRTAAKIYTSLEEVITAVLSGEVIAGMTTNKPMSLEVTSFGSGSVSVRGFMFKRSLSVGANPWQAAINLGIQNISDSGDFRRLKQQYYNNFGINTVEVRTCSGSPSLWQPDFSAIANSTLYLGGLGPSNWDALGNYLGSTFTGFFPEYTQLLAAFLQSNWNISIQWKWYGTSQSLMDALQTDEINCTDVYWTMPANYIQNNMTLPRIVAFDWSCAVLGTDNIFFVKTGATLQGDSTSSPLGAGPIAGIVISVAVTVLCLAVSLIYLIRREQKGNPLFQPMQDHSAPAAGRVVGMSQAL